MNSYKHRKLRLLVANEDPLTLIMIENSLKMNDIVEIIDVAQNGQQAMDMVIQNDNWQDKKTYDMIFLDLNMPIKDGKSACKDILTIYK